jgi:hypothetical protein
MAGAIVVFKAVHAGDPDPKLLSYQYLQMLPQLAKGDANKVFVIPSEFAEAFGGISKALSSGREAASRSGHEVVPAPHTNSGGSHE